MIKLKYTVRNSKKTKLNKKKPKRIHVTIQLYVCVHVHGVVTIQLYVCVHVHSVVTIQLYVCVHVHGVVTIQLYVCVHV